MTKVELDLLLFLRKTATNSQPYIWNHSKESSSELILNKGQEFILMLVNRGELDLLLVTENYATN